jgi:hypothetical protein
LKRLVQLVVIAGLVWAVRAVLSGGLTFGTRTFDSTTLARAIASHGQVNAVVVGIASVPASVTTAEAAAGIGRLRVLGIFQSTPEVRAALAGRVIVTGTILDAE